MRVPQRHRRHGPDFGRMPLIGPRGISSDSLSGLVPIVVMIVAVVFATFGAFVLLMPVSRFDATLFVATLRFVIPTMIVCEPPVRAIPVAFDVPTVIVVRRYPVRAFVRRARPITVVPEIVAGLRIPVPFDPREFGSRPSGHDIGTRRRGRADLDTEGDLRERCRTHQQHHTYC